MNTRREALAAALAAGAALVLDGCGSTVTHGASRRATTTTAQLTPTEQLQNVQVLNQLLDAEHRAIAAYTVVVPLFAGHAQGLARAFLNDELAHASELTGLIGRYGGAADPPAPSYDLGHPSDTRELLEMLEQVERDQIGAYLGAIPTVTPGPLRASLAAILGSDAQHIAVLRSRLGAAPLISPFVTGSA